MHFCRSDAERAMKYMIGENVDGFEMKMGWGKGVPIPLHPIYVPPALLKVTRPPEPNGADTGMPSMSLAMAASCLRRNDPTPARRWHTTSHMP